jgi:hypothetical protein
MLHNSGDLHFAGQMPPSSGLTHVSVALLVSKIMRSVKCVGCFFSYLTDRRQLIAPPDALPTLHLNSVCREVEQSVTGARQTIALIINFRKINKHL